MCITVLRTVLWWLTFTKFCTQPAPCPPPGCCLLTTPVFSWLAVAPALTHRIMRCFENWPAGSIRTSRVKWNVQLGHCWMPSWHIDGLVCLAGAYKNTTRSGYSHMGGKKFNLRSWRFSQRHFLHLELLFEVLRQPAYGYTFIHICVCVCVWDGVRTVRAVALSPWWFMSALSCEVHSAGYCSLTLTVLYRLSGSVPMCACGVWCVCVCECM